MQINKQNRNMNIYGYDILIGRDGADSLGFRPEIYELANISGLFVQPGQLAGRKSPAPLVTRSDGNILNNMVKCHKISHKAR